MFEVLIVLALVVGVAVRRRRKWNWRGKHVWIVGASKGIGRGVAVELAKRGAIVSVSARGDLNAVRSELGDSFGCDVKLDVSAGWEGICKAYDEVKKVGKVDVVIANAGINHQGRRFELLDEESIDRVISTNFTGIVRLCHVVLRDMKQGTFCVISSQAAYRGVPGASVYGATKAAVSYLVQALRVEMYWTDTRILAVHPGFVDTEAIRGLKHPKPFVGDVNWAANRVIQQIERDGGGFPWIMEVVLSITNLLPRWLYEAVLARFA